MEGVRTELVLVLALCGGCTQVFGLDSPTQRPSFDAAVDALATADTSDALGAVAPALHVPAAGQFPGTADVELTSIDTTLLTVNGVAPLPGVTFDVWPQAGGPDLAVLHVASLTVKAGTEMVYVQGSRPLVVIASGLIRVTGYLNASALGTATRAGGAAPNAGAGKGATGVHNGNFNDSGGGGAGFATAGAMSGGGATSCAQPALAVAGGTAYGDGALTVLVAGSGGGSAYMIDCAVGVGGAGGGAIQLSSASAIEIGGTVDAGGGGGGGGKTCATGSLNLTAGGGGGSGGAIVLQAPTVTITGVVAANGGAGGSAAGDPDSNSTGPYADGIAGSGGNPTATPAMPGGDIGQWSAAGGAGGAAAIAPAAGASSTECAGNGGGGGGSVGRIVIATPQTGMTALLGLVSPSAVMINY